MGIIGPFPQIEMQKESPRTRGFEGCYSHYFAGGFVLWRCRNSIRRYSAAPKRRFRSQFPLFPLNSKKLSPVCSSLPQFVLVCLNAAQSQNAREPMGSYLGHGFSGHPGRFPGSRWVTANCEQQLMGHMDVICQGRARQRSFYKYSPSSYDGSSIFDLYSSIRSSEQSMPAASKTIFSVSIFT